MCVHDAMPGRLVIGSVHDEADCSGRITVAKNFRKLAVRHNSAARNLSDYPEDTFSIIGIGCSGHGFALVVLFEASQHGPRRRTVAAAFCDL